MSRRDTEHGEDLAFDLCQWGRTPIGKPYFSLWLPSWQWGYDVHRDRLGWLRLLVIFIDWHCVLFAFVSDRREDGPACQL